MSGDSTTVESLLTWLIGAGVDITIGITTRWDMAVLRVALDLDDAPESSDGTLAELLEWARGYCVREGITP